MLLKFYDRHYAEPTLISRGRPEIRMESTDVVDFCTGRLGLTPEPKQEEVLRSTAKRGLLNCSRQWGKSTIGAAKAVHRAWTRAGSLILFASPTERQSAELLRKAVELARRLGVKKKGDGDNVHSQVFPNGSRIVALPGTESTVRGFSSVSLMLIDEASRVADSLYQALRPMLLVGDGDLWLMSTPLGKRGFFYDEFAYGGEMWQRFEGPATENPRIKPALLDEERRAKGAEHFSQEYLCQFVDSGNTLFASELLQNALDDELEPLAV